MHIYPTTMNILTILTILTILKVTPVVACRFSAWITVTGSLLKELYTIS